MPTPSDSKPKAEVRRERARFEPEADEFDVATLSVPYVLRFLLNVTHADELSRIPAQFLIGRLDFSKAAPDKDVVRRRGREGLDLDCMDEDDALLARLRFMLAMKPLTLERIVGAALKKATAASSTAAATWLRQRLHAIGQRFDWSATDIAVAELTWLAAQQKSVERWLDDLTNAKWSMAKWWSVILDMPISSVRTSLSIDGALSRSGLVHLSRCFRTNLCELPKLHASLTDVLQAAECCPDALTDKLLERCPKAVLGASEFAHLAEPAQALGRLLERAVQERARGINLLVFGPPGTGKSQFVRFLIERARMRGYEVPTRDCDPEDEDDFDAAVADRLGLVRGAHRPLAQDPRTAIVFDEAEDAFPRGSLFSLAFARHKSDSNVGRKAWVNRILEDAPIPTFWICNSIDHIDPAILRRFTFHLEMRKLGPRVRARIARAQAARAGLPEEIGEELAAYDDATPAMVESALRFAALAAEGQDAGEVAAAAAPLAARALRSALGAMNLKAVAERRSQPLRYGVAFLNWKGALAPDELLQALRRKGSASLCLYGVTGTGKPSFAEHLAEQLDMPLIRRRASDLQSKWVGECEKNIRAMFDEARAEGAMLLLDEADTFLLDRRSARQRWEYSETNELLQAMEGHEGLFVAATNLFRSLDPAALRRFTFKVAFLPLTSEQRAALFVQDLVPDAEATRASELWRRLDQLEGLTLGDFAVLARQSRLLGKRLTIEAALASLKGELESRGAAQPAIGFVR